MVNDDRRAIDDLTHAYADAVCRNDPEAWLDTLAVDGVWNIGRGEVVGRASLAEAFATAMSLFETVLQTAGSGVATDLSGTFGPPPGYEDLAR